MELQAIIGSPRNQCLRLSSCVCQLHGQRCCCTAGVSSQQRPQLFAGAVLKYMTRRGSSVLRSWPRMMPCSSPLSADSAIAKGRGERAADGFFSLSGRTEAGRHRRTQSYVSSNQLSLLTSYYLLLLLRHMRLRLPRQPGTHARTVAPPAYSSGLALRTGARPSVLPSPSPSERLAVEVSARSRGREACREARSRVAPWPPWPPAGLSGLACRLLAREARGDGLLGRHALVPDLARPRLSPAA